MRNLFVSAAFITVSLLLSAIPGSVAMADGARFFHEGDGRLRLMSEKNGKTFAGAYRLAAGGYDESALKAIHGVFGAPFDPKHPKVSLRLIAFLDFLEDRLNPGALITITSGYRSPEYNTKVRARGGLAAKASLHQYGMAADFTMAGVASEKVWRFVQDLGFGGTGYYHGRSVHVDVGPARSWDFRRQQIDRHCHRFRPLPARRDRHLAVYPYDGFSHRGGAGVLPRWAQRNGSTRPGDGF